MKFFWRKLDDLFNVFNYSYNDTRGLRAYPKSTPKKKQECPYKTERLVESDCV